MPVKIDTHKMEIDYKKLIRAIRNDGCVLFLGPEIAQSKTGESEHKKFYKSLETKYKDELKFNDEEGFFMFHEPDAKTDLIYDLKEFYENNLFAEDTLKLVAKIPFHFIVSATPDDTLSKVFRDFNIEHESANFERSKKSCIQPTKDKPLIYYILGLASKGNYILTQDDFYEYIKLVIGQNILPKEIVDTLFHATNFVFIGFEFDKWYIRLLMHILEFHLKKDGKTMQAIKPDDTNYIFQTLIEKQFNVTFIENNHNEFIETLYKKLDEEGLLRQLQSKEELIISQIKEKEDVLADYEELLILEEDPKLMLKYKKEINKIKTEIETLKQQLTTP